MVLNEVELEATRMRIQYFQKQVAHLRQVERNPFNYRLSSSGFLAEIERMNLEVHEYLALRPTEMGEK